MITNFKMNYNYDQQSKLLKIIKAAKSDPI